MVNWVKVVFSCVFFFLWRVRLVFVFLIILVGVDVMNLGLFNWLCKLFSFFCSLFSDFLMWVFFLFMLMILVSGRVKVVLVVGMVIDFFGVFVVLVMLLIWVRCLISVLLLVSVVFVMLLVFCMIIGI